MDPTSIVQGIAAVPPTAIAGYGVARHAAATLARRDGYATGRTVVKYLSERAVRRSGKQTRPGITRRARAYSVREYGRWQGRAVRPEGSRRVYLRWEDTCLVIAPPRAGKTARLGHEVIEAPGPCLATSTKVDIYQATAALRGKRGRVWLLNPEGMAGLASTFRWSPVPLCADPQTAITTAAYMVAAAQTGSGVQDQNFWQNQNAKVLRSLLYAAAVAGKTLADVAAWVTHPNTPEPLHIVQSHPGTPAGWAAVLRQIATTPAEKTRESVYLTLQLVFEFMADPAIAQIATPRPGQDAFHIDAFLRSRDTLYLLGSAKEYGGMGPLFAALTGLIFERAKRTSQASPGGRLDPPLSLVLDEATNICPVPLPQWCSDAGGRGIALTAAIQSPSQLEDRWGRAGRETVWQAANAKIILGGLSVQADLEALSAMFGEKDEPTPRARHPKAHREPPVIRRVPVVSPAAIRELAEGHALLTYRHLKVVELVMRPVWKRRDVRREQRHAIRQATVPPAYPDDPAGHSDRLAEIVELPTRWDPR